MPAGLELEALGQILRSRSVAGSPAIWSARLQELGVMDSQGSLDEVRAEHLAVALEMIGDSFMPVGASSGWDLVATLPNELRRLLDPPPVLHTGGVILELIDAAVTDVRLAAPYADDPAVNYLLNALTRAAKRRVDVFIATSAPNGPHFQPLAAAWPSEGGSLNVVEVATALSPLGSHAKAVVVDGCLGYIGSANLTAAGLGRNVELGVRVWGPQVESLSVILKTLFTIGAVAISIPNSL